MNIPKELIDQWWAEWHSEGRVQPVLEYIAQRAVAWALSQPVSMEPAGYHIGPDGERRNHYTADQLAAARLQGAEEVRVGHGKWIAELESMVNVRQQRIAELEQKNAVFLEALKRARDTAMKYTLVARIPECGHFGGIAQDLDYVYAAIAEVKQ